MTSYPSPKDFATAGAALALLGYELIERRTCRGSTYTIRRRAKAYEVTTWHDVLGVLASLGGHSND